MTTQQVDPLRECKEAKEEFDAVTHALNAQGEVLVQLGQGLLADPISVKLANSGLARPMDLPDDYLIDYKAVPSREDIKDGLSKYDTAHAAYDAALRKLPPDEQDLFVGGSTRREARITF